MDFFLNGAIETALETFTDADMFRSIVFRLFDAFNEGNSALSDLITVTGVGS